MKFSEIAPPGREKQVKKLKKKFDDPSAAYAIAWAQHNKHGKPKKESHEDGPSDMGMNKYGLSATKLGDKFRSYRHGKLTGEFDSMEELQKHQMELIKNEGADDTYGDEFDDHEYTTREELAKELYLNGSGAEHLQKEYSTWEEYMDSEDFEEDVLRLRNKFESNKVNERMPASIIKHKEKLAHMTDKELADRFKDFDETRLRQMAWRHGYGKMSSYYWDRVQAGKNESVGSSEHSEVKAILDKHGITKADDIELGTPVYDELFGYYMDSGEMPYGVMKARDGMPDEWIWNRVQELGLLDEGRMSEIDVDIKTLSDAEFQKKYGKSKEQMQKDLNEAPFGSVKKAVNKVKKVVGKVPGLGDMKTKADAEANIGKVANDVWKDYLQFKQTDPDPTQVKGWFKTNHGMDVEPDSNSNVDKDDIIPGIKQAMAAKQSRTKATPDASPQDAQDIKVKLDLLKKSDPNANAATMVAIKKMAAGDMVDPTRQQALQPLVSKIAKALNNPGKANLLSRALAESLSQSDLSKLDMLARQGMVPKNKVARFKTAMRTLSKGKDLPISYKDDVIDVVTKLAKIITKPSVMGMVRKGLKEEHKQTAQEKFRTWVNQADDIIS